MLFTDWVFWVFLNLLVLILLATKRHDHQKAVYLVASYLFYMWWNPAFILLIVFSTMIDFIVGNKIYRSNHRQTWLLISIATNLSLLGFFKYFGFFEENLLLIFRLLGWEPSWTAINVILPVGISFYTFQTMSYSIDIYRGKLKPTESPLDFAVFVAFFPQLVAGPIVRAAEFLPQIAEPRKIGLSKQSLTLVVKGLVKKVIVADNLGYTVDHIFQQPEQFPSIIIWAATICFSVQIYCDFSGYTDIAIGIASFLGFQFPQNFNRPYFARTPSEFWSRWHITLSTWLRDYLYIPLGGNRLGNVLTYRNLMITMLLGGLWHGASWNFVLWGFLHGCILCLYRLLNVPSQRVQGFGAIFEFLIFQWLVLVTWIVFRCQDLGVMSVALHKFLLFDFDFQIANMGLANARLFSSLLLLSGFVVLHIISYLNGGLERAADRLPWKMLYALLFPIGICFYLLMPTEDAPFIYFQF